MNNNNNYYNNISETFKVVSISKKKYLDAINCFVKNNIKDGLLLDVGSGDGLRLKEIIKSKSVTVNIVESSDRMVQQALKIFDEKLIYNCSFENFNIPRKYSTVLALWNVLGHVDNRIKFLKKVHSCLEDDGVFIFDVNNRFNIKQYGLKSFFVNVFKDFFRIPGAGYFNIKHDGVETSVYIYSEKDLLKDLNKSGLRVIDIKYIDYGTGLIAGNKFMGQIFMVVCKK